MVILKNHLRLLFICKSQLLIFWLYTIMESINNKFLVFKNDQNLQHHFELARREPKAIFGSIIGWYLYKKEKIFFFDYLSGHMYFSAPVRSQVPRTWNLKNLKTGLFLSLLCVIFWFLTPKDLPIPNFKMKGLEQ